MKAEQLEQAEKKLKELMKFNRDNESIRKFIENLGDAKYLTIGTAHQYDLSIGAKEAFELIGPELIDLLKKKLWEREDYLERIGAEDLIGIDSTEVHLVERSETGAVLGLSGQRGDNIE